MLPLASTKAPPELLTWAGRAGRETLSGVVGGVVTGCRGLDRKVLGPVPEEGLAISA